METETEFAAERAAKHLDLLLERAQRDSAAVVQTNDIPITVRYFDELRDTVKILAEKMTALQKHVDQLSQDTLPTMFTNQNVKTITVKGVGRTTINVRWSASLLNKEAGFVWLRSSGNEGLITETVNAQTLGAWAKEQTMAGKPPPADIFKVGSAPYVSITKG